MIFKFNRIQPQNSVQDFEQQQLQWTQMQRKQKALMSPRIVSHKHRQNDCQIKYNENTPNLHYEDYKLYINGEKIQICTDYINIRFLFLFSILSHTHTDSHSHSLHMGLLLLLFYSIPFYSILLCSCYIYI